jgi:hypothetical protein
MVNSTGLAQSGYYLDDTTDGMTLVRRHGSDTCVGRLHRAEPGPETDRWLADLGQLRVMTPYASRGAAVAAVCAYADMNPQLAI